MKTYKIKNIVWDYDNFEPTQLPKHFLINVEIENGLTEIEIEDRIGDAISSKYGYCFNGYSYEENR